MGHTGSTPRGIMLQAALTRLLSGPPSCAVAASPATRAPRTLRCVSGETGGVPCARARQRCVIMGRATPVPVDVDINKWTIDPSEIRKNITQRTKAVIVVHFLGNPCDLKKISNICKKEKIFLIEDCAEAIGSKFNGEMVGNYGDCSTYSFFGNKTITTGEGGMITFKNKNIFEKANILRDHGMSKKKKILS